MMIRQELFTQIGLDSGALTMLGAVVHPLTEPGIYRGSVQLDEAEVGHFHVTVDPSSVETQADVDLAAVHAEGGGPGAGPGDECSYQEPAGSHAVQPGGFLVLHVGSGRGGYSVVLAAGQGSKRKVVFDSRHLGRGDLFTATVLRPGRYSVTNTENRARGSLVVAYPARGGEPYRPGEAVSVTVGKGLEPSEVEVGAAQPQVFAAETATRIVIELEEPFDADAKGDGPRHRGTRPRPRRVEG